MLNNIIITLTKENSAFTQHQVWLKIQLKALQSQQLQQQITAVTKSERLSDSAVFNSSQDKLKDFLLKLWVKMIMKADYYSLPQNKLWYVITWVTDKTKDQILLYCISNTVNLTDLTVFKELMQNTFRDSD